VDAGSPRNAPDGRAPSRAEQRPLASTDAAGRQQRFAWVPAVTDRVPTSWFTGIATAVFLAVTAAFGGLADVPAPPLPRLAAGDTHVNDQLAITVERAVLIDEFAEAGVEVEPGERVLALVVRAENRWTEPLDTGGDHSVASALRIPALGDEPPAAVARFDDATVSPWLQPGVPAELVVTWAVADDAFAEGELLDIDLRNETLHTGELVAAGRWWDDPVTAARLEVELTDVGAGAEAGGAE
jgi:hypothetical protein